MNKDQHDKIIEDLKLHLGGIIEDSIKKYVNGKIDNLTIISNEAKEISKAAGEVAYIASKKNETLNEEIRGLIIQVKEQIKPIIDIQTKAKGFTDVSVWLGKYIIVPFIALIGLIATIKQIIK